MRGRSFVLPILALLLAAGAADGLSVQQLLAVVPTLTTSELARLAKGERLTRDLGPGELPRLMPISQLSSGLASAITSFAYTTGVEVLYVDPRDPGSDRADLLRWYNVLRSVSTLKGLSFYSPVNRRDELLFRDSYAVDNPVDDQRIPDPLVTRMPAASRITLMQNDVTFGPNLYALDYRAAPDAVSVTMININSLNFLFIPVIGARQMQIRLLVMPYKSYRLFYGNVVARAGTLFGLGEKVQESALARLSALYTWFSRMASRDQP